MGEDYAALRPLAPVAALLATKSDWPKLYNSEGMRKSDAACAVSEHIY